MSTPRSKKIFMVVAVIFVTVVIGFLIHFISLSTAPWKKKKPDTVEQTGKG